MAEQINAAVVPLQHFNEAEHRRLLALRTNRAFIPGDVLIGTDVPQGLTDAGAVNITSMVTEITTTTASALTMADGTIGQIKFLIMVTDGGDATLTPTNFGSGTTITFNDAGDTAILYFTNGKWYFMGGTATVA